MIFFVIEFFRNLFSFSTPAVFSYYSTRMIFAAITSLCITVFLGPWFIKKLYELKIGQSIRVEDCPMLGKLHEKKRDTPTMGGVLMICSLLISLFLWMDLTKTFTLILLITTVWLGIVGGYDDYLKLKYRNTAGLSMRKKLLCQLILVVGLSTYFYSPALQETIHHDTWFSPPAAKEFVTKDNKVTTENLTTKEYLSRLYVPFVKKPLFLGSLSLLGVIASGVFMFFVVTGTSNAVNLTDGLDGLAAGCLIMVATTLALIAFVSNHIDISRYLNILYIEHSGEIAIYLCALSGSCLGFLWYNSHPAQLFMGDTGSLTFGGIIGVSAFLLNKEILLALIGGIFVIEALSVILQVASFRWRNKKRIFLCAPLHHHFEYKGIPETKIVIRFWIVALLLAIIGLATLKLQ
jgi:phospho-N-acetylmuramoyl-pentapeptide-transferase